MKTRTRSANNRGEIDMREYTSASAIGGDASRSDAFARSGPIRRMQMFGVRMCIAAVLLVACALCMCLGAGTAFAASYEKVGNLTDFAKKLSIAEVTFNQSAFSTSTVPVVTGSFANSGTRVYYTGEVKANVETQAVGGFTYTYPNGATLPDGTTADVTVAYSDVVFRTGMKTSTFSGYPIMAESGVNPRGGIYSNASGTWSFIADMKVTVTVVGADSSYTYVFPGHGINTDMTGNTGSYQKLVELFHAREQFAYAGSSTLYIPDITFGPDVTATSGGGVLLQGAGRLDSNGNSTDNSYASGFALDGTSGMSVSFTTLGGTAGGMNEFIKLGDLTRTHTSSSGVGGTIKTTKGTGLDEANAGGTLNDGSTVLSGGTAAAPLTYSVPNYKTVTYTMTPNAGYTIDTLTVDGATATPTERTDTNGNKFWTYTFGQNTSNHIIHVTWKHLPGAELTATKVWANDYDNAFGTRTDVVMHIDSYRDNNGTEELVAQDVLPAQRIAASATGSGLSVTWGNLAAYTDASGNTVLSGYNLLPKYDTDDATMLIYKAREESVPNGYAASDSHSSTTSTDPATKNMFTSTITNALDPVSIDHTIQLKKTVEGATPERGKFAFTITAPDAAHAPAVTTRRNGDVYTEQAGVRSYSDAGDIEFGPITFTYDDLVDRNAGGDITGASAKTFTYTVSEQPANDPKYVNNTSTYQVTLTVAPVQGGGITVTQTPSASSQTAVIDNALASAEIGVSKSWSPTPPANNPTLTFELRTMVGEGAPSVDEKDSAPSGDSWPQVSWAGLDLEQGGQGITYAVNEQRVSGYTTTYAPETTSYAITTANDSAWKQSADRASVTVQLRQNGKVYDTHTFNSANGWDKTWSDLPKVSASGVVYFYDYVIVAPASPSAHYDQTLAEWQRSVTYAGGLTANVAVTNTQQTITVYGEKLWNDNRNADSKRTSYAMRLLKDGEESNAKSETPEATAASQTSSWANLPVTESGAWRQYSVDEKTPPTSYEASAPNPQAATISLSVETDPATATAWAERGSAPAFEVRLLRNGALFESSVQELNSSNNWKATWAALPTLDANGATYVYDWECVDRRQPADWNYTATGFDDQYGQSMSGTTQLYKTSVKNTLQKDVTVKKTWEGKPVTAVEIELVRWKGTGTPQATDLAGGVDDAKWESLDPVKMATVATEDLNANQEATRTFTVPAYDGNGNALHYRAKELTVNAYYFSTTYDDDGLTVKNKNEVKDGQAELSVVKDLVGRSWNAGESYSFKLTPVTEDAPMPRDNNDNVIDVVSVTNESSPVSDSARIRRGAPIQFTTAQAGHTYEYAISEVVPITATAAINGAIMTYGQATDAGSGASADDIANAAWTLAGVTYSAKTVGVHIAVSESQGSDTSATVNTSVTYTGDNVSAIGPTFTNTYAASADVQVPVAKEVPGYSGTSDTFEFTIDAIGDAPMPANNGTSITFTNTEHGGEGNKITSAFDAITFSLDDLRNVTASTGERTYSANAGALANTAVPAGTKYGRFIYAIREKAGGATDRFAYDSERTIYARVTVIDKRDGTLDASIEYFTDALCGSMYTAADVPTFVNSQLHDITVTKKWDGPVMRDSTVEVQQLVGSQWVETQAASSYTFRRSAFTGVDAANVGVTHVFRGLPTYDSAGNAIQYRIVETAPVAADGYTVTYQLGTGAATQDYTAASLASTGAAAYTVTNKYDHATTVQVAAVKELLGRVWLGNTVDSYHFRLQAVGNGQRTGGNLLSVPMPGGKHGSDSLIALSSTPATSDNGHKVSKADEYLALFDDITVKVSDLSYNGRTGFYEGDFYYRLEEVRANGTGYEPITANAYMARGVTYPADAVHVVHIHAQDDLHGNVSATVSYDDDTGIGTRFTPVVTNEYDASGAGTASVVKFMTGRAWRADDTFTFTLQPIGGAPFDVANNAASLSLTVSGGTDGGADARTGTFAAIPFRLSSLSKTVPANNATASDPVVYADGTRVPAGLKYDVYTYEITEDEGDNAGLLYDGDDEFVQFTVIDKGDGTLDVATKYFEDQACSKQRVFAQGETAGAPFTNIELKSIDITKVWKGIPAEDVTVSLRKVELSAADVNNLQQAPEAPQTDRASTDEAGKQIVSYDGRNYKVSTGASVVKLGNNGDSKYYEVASGTYLAEVNGTAYLVPAGMWANIDTDEWTTVSATSVEFDAAEFDAAGGTQDSASVTKQVTGLPMQVQRTEASGRIVQKQVVYRVDEASSGGYTTEYAMSAQSDDETGAHRAFTVTNNSRFTATGSARVSAVKELVARDWKAGDAFDFQMVPVGRAAYDATTGELIDPFVTSGGVTTLDASRLSDYDVQAIPVSTSDENPEARVLYGGTASSATAADAGTAPTGSQRQAEFGAILYNQNDLVRTADGTWQADYYYELSEVIGNGYVALSTTKPAGADENDFFEIEGVKYYQTGITWGGADATARATYTYWLDATRSIAFSTAKHYAHVHVERIAGNALTCQVSYDGRPADSGNLPVFTNHYDAESRTWGHVLKHIDGRNFGAAATASGSEITGDAFSFGITGLGGSMLKPTSGSLDEVAEDTYMHTTKPLNYDGHGVMVAPSTDGNSLVFSAVSGEGADMAARTGEGMLHLSDLNNGSGSFTYAIHEHAGTGHYDGKTVAKVEDLEYDDATVYLRIEATDNGDGTLNIDYRYYTDAACTQRLKVDGKVPQVWVSSTDGHVLTGAASDAAKAAWQAVADATASLTALIVSGTASDQELAQARANVAAARASALATGSMLVDVGYFTNERILNIPVSKKWVDSTGAITDPLQDVTLQLQEAVLTDSMHGSGAQPANTTQVIASDGETYYVPDSAWGPSEGAATFLREDFYYKDGDEIPAGKSTGDLREDGASKTIAGMPHMKGDNKVVYRVAETPASGAYSMTSELMVDAGDTTTKKVAKTGEGATGNIGVYVNGGTLAVTNAVSARNTVQPTAVKQLVGRNWSAADKFSFTLSPLGKANYNSDGSLDTGTGKIDLIGVVLKTAAGGGLDTDIPVPGVAPTAEVNGADVQPGQNGAIASLKTGRVAVGEHLATFGAIEYKETDLEYNPTTGHLQGDFYYQLSEDVPANAVASDHEGNPLKFDDSGNVSATGESALTYADAKNGFKLATYHLDSEQDYGNGQFRYFTVQKGTSGFDGITYDATVHILHVHVEENSTNKLVASMVYDQANPTDDNTGAKYTLVHTNYYSATGTATIGVEKQKLGGDWSGTTYTFTMRPLAGAPFIKADFTPYGEGRTQTTLEAPALGSGEGGANIAGTVVQRAAFAPMGFTMNDLTQTVGAGNATSSDPVKYSDGNLVPAGVLYGRFTYQINEENPGEPSVKYDPDYEYARVTAINMQNGAIQTVVEYSKDLNFGWKRTDVQGAPFTNLATHSVWVEKEWNGIPNADATVHLERAEVNGSGEVIGEWKNLVTGGDTTYQHTFTPSDFANSSTAKHEFTGLISREATTNIETGAIVYHNYVYRVVEDNPAGATYVHQVTDGAVDTGVWGDEAHPLKVKNTTAYTTVGTAVLSAAKQLDNRTIKESLGDFDNFKFTVAPFGTYTYHTPASAAAWSTVINGASYTKADAEAALEYGTITSEQFNAVNWPSAGSIVYAADGKTPVYEASSSLALPSDAQSTGLDRRGDDAGHVYISEFEPVTYDPSILSHDTANGVWRADLLYTMNEVIPAGAVADVGTAENPSYVAYSDASAVYASDVPSGWTQATATNEQRANASLKWVYKGVVYDNSTYYAHVHLEKVGEGDSGTVATSVEYLDSNWNPTPRLCPYFANTYTSKNDHVGSWTIKDIQGRGFQSYNLSAATGDAFQFLIAAVGGAAMDPFSDLHLSSDNSTMLSPVMTSENVTGLNAGTELHAIDANSVIMRNVTFPVTNSLLDSNGEAYLLYSIREQPAASIGESSYTVGDLLYDEGTTQYMRYHLKDNWDGTISYDLEVFSDASCTTKVTGNDVYLGTDDKVVVNPTDAQKQSLKKVSAARFANTRKMDIPVEKDWVGVPSGDVVVHLERALFPVELENGADGLNNAADADAWVTSHLSQAAGESWHGIGLRATLPRTDFWDDATNAAKGAGTETRTERTQTTKLTRTIDNASKTVKVVYEIDDFNKNLPLYVTGDGTQGTTAGQMYRAVYHLIEDSTSNAYTTTYKSVQPGGTTKDNDQIFVDSGTMVIINDSNVKGTADIGAVKQLLDRDWNADETFTFTIEPLGKAEYYTDTVEGEGGHVVGDPIPDAGSPVGVRLASGSASSIQMPKNGEGSTTSTASAQKGVNEVGAGEFLASFDGITYSTADLVYDPDDHHLQGDFYYALRENVPDSAIAVVKSGDAMGTPVKFANDGTEEANGTTLTYGDARSRASFNTGAYYWKIPESDAGYNGLLYDGSAHYVHVKVRENRTDALQVQVIYDQTAPLDDTTGKQFVPVFTNRYQATYTLATEVYKKIDGSTRNWEGADAFTFRLGTMSAAPMPAGYDEETGIATATINGTESFYELNTATGKYEAVTSPTAANRIKGATFNAITYTMDNLYATAEKDIKKGDAVVVEKGQRYGMFFYAIAELDPGAGNRMHDLAYDPDRIFVMVLVTDEGSGHLKATPYFYSELIDLVAGVSGADDNLAAPLFINVEAIDIPVVKNWDGTAVADATVKLQSRPQGSTDDTAWKDTGHTVTFARSEFNAASKVEKQFDDVALYDGDTPLQFRIVEEGMSGTGFTVSYENNPWDGTTVNKMTVTNKYEASATTSASAVKQLLGRANDEWISSDKFDFELTAAGKGSYYTAETAANYNNAHAAEIAAGTLRRVSAGELIGLADDSAAAIDASPEIPMPHGQRGTGSAKTTVSTTVDDGEAEQCCIAASGMSQRVAANEHLATFGKMEYSQADLTYNEGTGFLQGDFFYTMREAVPVDATATIDGAVVKYGEADAVHKDDASIRWEHNGITYTREQHTVHVLVTDNLTGNLTAQVFYDESRRGDTTTATQFTPVFINRYVSAGELKLEAAKTMNSRIMTSGETYTVRVEPLAGSPMPYASGTSGARVTALDIALSGDNATNKRAAQSAVIPLEDEGTYLYELYEVLPDGVGADGVDSAANVRYDTRHVYAQVVVTDDPETGVMQSLVKYYRDASCANEYLITETVSDTSPGAAAGATREVPASGAPFTNTQLRDIEATKTWVGEALDDVTLTLESSTDGGTTWTAVDSRMIAKDATGDALKAAFNDVAAYTDEGVEIAYRITEAPATFQADSNAANRYINPNAEAQESFVADPAQTVRAMATLDSLTTPAKVTVTNKNTSTFDFHGTKIWVDGQNTQDTRPDNPPTLTLYRTAGEVPAQGADMAGAVSAGNAELVANVSPSWSTSMSTFTYADLPLYDDAGKTYTYWVTEQAVNTSKGKYTEPAYANPVPNAAFTDRAYNGGTVTNTIKQEEISVSGVKAWEHGSNTDSSEQPTSATVNLRANGVAATHLNGDVVAPVTVTASNDSNNDGKWEFSFTSLPKYDAEGAVIAYTVTEEPVAGYTYTVTGNVADGFTITNTYNASRLADILQVHKVIQYEEAWKRYLYGTNVPAGNWWKSDTKFVVDLLSISNNVEGLDVNPMPAGSESESGETYKRLEITDSTQVQKGFGSIAFDTPGEYVYRIRELTPAEAGTTRLAGMTYDTNAYTVKVTVADDMSISTEVTDKEGNVITPDSTSKMYDLTFTNAFKADEVEYIMLAEKAYSDRAGQLAVGDVSGAFDFTMRPVDTYDANGDVITSAAETPMPTDYYLSDTGTGLQGTGADRVYYARNNNYRVLFAQDSKHAITFTRADNLNKYYTYELAEVVPDDAVYIGDGFWYNAADETVYDGVVHVRRLQIVDENGALDAKAVNVNLGEHADKYLNPETGKKYADAKNGEYADAAELVNATSAKGKLYPRYKNKVPQFLNVHNPLVDVKATKVWDDGDNADKRRPDYTYFKLGATVDGQPFTGIADYAGHVLTSDELIVKIGGSKTDAGLAVTWANLPLYLRTDTDSTATNPTYKRITYTVTEVDADGMRQTPAGYKLAVTGSDTEGFTFTNTHVPKQHDVTVAKLWDDADDQDGVRPQNLTLHIDQTLDTVTTTDSAENKVANSADGWKVSWVGQPLNAVHEGSQVKPYTYTVREDAPDGYTAETPVEGATGLRVTLAWDSSFTGSKPDEAVVVVEDEVGNATSRTATLSAANGWSHVFANVPAGYSAKVSDGFFSSAQKAAYQVVEAVVTNYTITNTRTPDTTSVTATKVWDDDANRDGKRPTVKLQLQRRLDGGTTWTAVDGQGDFSIAPDSTTLSKTWDNLPKKERVGNASVDVSYHVVELDASGLPADAEGSAVKAAGYTSVRTGDAEAGYTFTNSYTPERASLKVAKTWDDTSNVEGLRSLVKVHLYKGEGDAKVPVGEKTLLFTTADDTSVQWDDLYVYENGKKIVYSVEEETVEGYSSSGVNTTGITLAPENTAANPYVATFTNKHTVDEVELTVRKVWADTVYSDGVAAFGAAQRPDSVTLRVTGTATSYKGNDPQTIQVDVPITPLEADKGKAVWEKTVKLPKYVNLASAGLPDDYVAFTYTVDESNVPANYRKTVMPISNAVVNTYDMVTFTGTKKWQDDGRAHDNAGEVKLTLERMVEGGAWTVVDSPHIDWNGDEFTVQALPAKDASGAAYTYRVTEANVAGGYEAPVYSNAGNADAGRAAETGFIYSGGTIVNGLSVVSITGEVVWNDDEAAHVSKDESKLVLYRISDASGAEEEVVGAAPTWGVGDDDDAYSFTGLPGKDASGATYTYYVKQQPVDGFDTTYVNAAPDADTTAAKDSGRIINTRAGGTVPIEVKVKWDDSDNADRQRPLSVDVTLYKSVGGDAPVAVGEPMTLTADENWTGLFRNLPRFEEGKPVTYTVAQTKFTDPEHNVHAAIEDAGYAATSGDPSGSAEEGFVFTNKREAGMVAVSATKAWNDASDSSKRADVVLHLVGTANGWAMTEKATVATGAAHDQNMTATWEVPLYHDGVPVEYHVYEEAVEGYASEVSQTRDDETARAFTVKNTLVGQTDSVAVVKTWSDGDDCDGKRASVHAVLQLQKRVGSDGAWVAVADDDEVLANASMNVRATDASGNATSVISGQKKGSYAFDGSGEVSSFEVTWTGLAKQVVVKGTQLDGAAAELSTQSNSSKAADASDKSAEIDGGADASAAQGDVSDEQAAATDEMGDAASGGQVEAGSVAGEDAQAADPGNAQPRLSTESATSDSFSFVEQAYADEVSTQADSIKPVYYRVVELNADGSAASSATGSIAAAGYVSVLSQTSSGSFEIHNVHVPETRDITVSKIWIGDDEVIEHGSVAVTLTKGADKQPVADSTAEIAQGDPHTWHNLPVYEAGQVIEYGVVENNVPDGYVASYGSDGDDLLVFNTKVNMEHKVVVATKAWNDRGSTDAQHPEVTLRLMKKVGEAGGLVDAGRPAKTIAAGAEGDALTVTWGAADEEPLPAFENGEQIAYSVREDAVDGYTATYSDGQDQADGVLAYTVTNVREDATGGTGQYVGGIVMLSYIDPLREPGDQVVTAYKGYWGDIDVSKLADATGSEVIAKYYTATSESFVDEAEPATDLVTQGESTQAAGNGTLGAQAALSPTPGVVPADPEHAGYTFAGWAENKDDYGNVYMVAQYTLDDPEKLITVNYVDCKAEDKLAKSELVKAADWKSVAAPADPAHEGFKFAGWSDPVIDKGGNYIYVAQYESSGENTPGGNTPGGNTPGGDTPGGYTPGGTANPGGATAARATPAKGGISLPTTGDKTLDTVIILGIIALIAATTMLAVRRAQHLPAPASERAESPRQESGDGKRAGHMAAIKERLGSLPSTAQHFEGENHSNLYDMVDAWRNRKENSFDIPRGRDLTNGNDDDWANWNR